MTNHSQTIETRSEASARRTKLRGDVDFTMMYVAHDAFNRDLARLLQAAEAGRHTSQEAVATWQLFERQLHTHHTAEDKALWPLLRDAAAGPDDHAVLDAMEAEHASLDPLLKRIDEAITAGDATTADDGLQQLAIGLGAHMIHEEAEALPLLEARLGKTGWDAFGDEIRDSLGGMKGAAEYLPWVLDGASDDVRKKVLGLLPAPARLIFRRSWEPRYRKAIHL